MFLLIWRSTASAPLFLLSNHPIREHRIKGNVFFFVLPQYSTICVHNYNTTFYPSRFCEISFSGYNCQLIGSPLMSHVTCPVFLPGGGEDKG